MLGNDLKCCNKRYFCALHFHENINFEYLFFYKTWLSINKIVKENNRNKNYQVIYISVYCDHLFVSTLSYTFLPPMTFDLINSYQNRSLLCHIKIYCYTPNLWCCWTAIRFINAKETIKTYQDEHWNPYFITRSCSSRGYNPKGYQYRTHQWHHWNRTRTVRAKL